MLLRELEELRTRKVKSQTRFDEIKEIVDFHK